MTLDHVRALAVYAVFCWHFLHVNDLHTQQIDHPLEAFLLSWISEGHTGVSLFMVLSGFIFATLMRDNSINYRKFLYARAQRIFPLFLIVASIAVLWQWHVSGSIHGLINALLAMIMGFWLPSWPNGGWSLTVELHFYALFPFILFIIRRHLFWLAMIAGVLFLVKLLIIIVLPDEHAKFLIHLTLIGRFDQFIVGVLLGSVLREIRIKHWQAGLLVLVSLSGYAIFKQTGGLAVTDENAILWVLYLSVEGVIYGLLIQWYFTSFKMKSTGMSGAVASIGAASYSIYLWHFFIVFNLASLIDRWVTLDSHFIALVLATILFIPVSLLGYASYHWIEKPFLRNKRSYFNNR